MIHDSTGGAFLLIGICIPSIIVTVLHSQAQNSRKSEHGRTKLCYFNVSVSKPKTKHADILNSPQEFKFSIHMKDYIIGMILVRNNSANNHWSEIPILSVSVSSRLPRNIAVVVH